MNLSTASIIFPLLTWQEQSPPAEKPPTANDRCWEEARERYQIQESTIAKFDKDTPSPRRLVYVEPIFPRELEDATVTGVWLGVALVGPDGLVADAWPLREPDVRPPFPGFSKVIVDAVKKWQYEPLTIDDEKIPHCIVVAVNTHEK